MQIVMSSYRYTPWVVYANNCAIRNATVQNQISIFCFCYFGIYKYINHQTIAHSNYWKKFPILQTQYSTQSVPLTAILAKMLNKVFFSFKRSEFLHTINAFICFEHLFISKLPVE